MATSEPKGKQETQAIGTQGLILMNRVKNLEFPGPKPWIGVNLKGKLNPQDTILNTQKLLPILLQSRD